MFAGVPAAQVHAAIVQQVQSGTAVSSANGTTTVAISSVDMTTSVLIFQARSNSNEPDGSLVRGRLASATTIEFIRVTNDVPGAVVINIQWYLATFGSGVFVQRGETPQSATTVNVAITSVTSVSQAFVLYSKSATAGDTGWNANDPLLGELTSPTQLTFRTNATATHMIAWQVVQFTNAADINVQKGSILAAMTGATLTATATLSPAVNVNKTFVLAGIRATDGTTADIGTRMVRAVLTNSTTITFDRAVAAVGSDITEIVWQAVELKDGSTVQGGSLSFANGAATATADMSPGVNVTRAVGLISTQGGGGQNMGRSPYATDDIVGVATATASVANDQLTLTRSNTASTADLGWFVVQFDGGSPFKVGSFTKTSAAGPVTQVIAHGLGQVPKAMILWTEGRSDETFSTATGIAFRAARQAAAVSGTLTLTIIKPTGTVQNDVMVASIGVSQAAAATITAPGWTLVRRTSNANATANALAVYYKVAGAAEPASYAFTFSASTGSAGGIQSFSGVDVHDPVDIDLGVNTTNASLNHIAPAVTTTMANTMIVTSHSFAASATWTFPAGMAEAIDVASLAVPNAAGQSIEANWVLRPAIGLTPTYQATASAGNLDRGNAHTLALKPASPAYFGFGMSDGTISKSVSASMQNDAGTSDAANRIADNVLTIVKWDTASAGIVLAEADLQSWDSTNLTLNWSTNDPNAYVIHYMAMGSTDLSAKVISWTLGTAANPALPISGVGFQPNVVLHAHASYLQTALPPTTALAGGGFGLGAMDADGNQWANGFFSRDASGTTNTQRGQRTDAFLYSFDQALTVQKQAAFVSMDPDGFTVNVSNSTSGNDAQVISLALAGLNAQVGSFIKTNGAQPAIQDVTGVNFQPAAVLLTSVQDIARAAPVAQARFGIGASDGTTEGSSAFIDQNGVTVSNVIAIDKTSKVFVKMNTNTAVVDAEADLTAMNVDGFRLNWTTNDTAVAQQIEILYLAMAPMDITEVRLISFTAAKYDSGVLLQWRTGYEIDNLGFNLYREINGVRTQVNTSLIAGSGLQAGRGGVVTAEQNYARWDLDADASDPTVTYWLEDVEFNGKSKWHGPLTPVASQLQEPSTVDSAELGDIGNATNSRRIFFNYNDDPLHPGPRAVPAQVEPEVTIQWALADQPTVKLGISKPGWYRVTQPELIAAGLSSDVNPDLLHLFVDGTEQAIRVTGATDGSFDPADAIEFYGSGIETPHTDTRTYWLQAGAEPGRRVAVAASGSSAPSTLTGFSSTLRRKDRSVYFAALRNGDTENWFGPMVYPEPAVPDPDDPWAPAALTLTPNHIDRSAAGPAQLTVALQGVTTVSDGSANHRIGVLVNGTDVGEMTFAGQAHAEQTFAVLVPTLLDGENTVTLEARGGDAETDSSLVDAIRLDYPHTYQADADRLRLTVDAPGSITIGGFASASIRVFDITDRTAPVELPGTVGADAGLSTVTVHVPGSGLRTLMAFSDETVASPAFVQENHPSNLHANTNAYDYVLISHADFVTQVAPLAALREQQGHRAVVVDVEDVYDEFSFGEKTPQAIRDFLQWARTNWATAPKFVVLAGDATIDPRDYEGLGNADFVPTKQLPMNQAALETASDDWFVDFSDNGLPEIAIGRLSVRTDTQAQAMVGKIVGYDSTVPQPWMKNVLLVADQNDATSDFERSSRNLSALLPQDYTAQTVFRGALGDAVAHQALVDGVNEGQLIVNYTGHGSTGIWGGSGELLTNADVTGSWTNAAKLPFVVAMNCLNGLFNGIYGEESLAEALVRAPNGGAVAAWASSSLTPSATQSLVNQELFRLIFGGTYATVGEAIAAAKRVVASQDLRRSWIFFGDPAMRLIGAPQPVSTNPPVITTQPLGTTIASGQQAVLNVVVTGSAPLTYQWYVGASGQTTNPIAGATSSTFTQAVTNTTSYWVRVSNPYGTADSSVAVMSTPLAITTANPWPTVTAGAAYALTLEATDTTPPYQWDATTLPSGLTLNPATGDIDGTPNGAGTFSVEIRVTDGDAVWAQQTFSLTVQAATDELIDQQWYLKDRAVEVAAANVEPAWAATRGAGVVIGIVDDGLQSTHPDLQANYLASLSYDFTDDDDADPSPATVGACGTTANCRGTAVAGIAAARSDNGSGGSGVAPLASLAGIRLAPQAIDADEAAAFSHQLNAVHIENNSWRRPDDGQSLAAPGPRALAALSTAIAQGRAGLGRIFVWAAGDGRASGDNCNFDGYANSRFGIAVGAVDDTGQQASYSESCSALLVSAPSSGAPGVNRSLTTTDLVGEAGDDPGDYTSGFGGTSAAAPVVSGVAALMLARNPALTWRDVQHLLVRSSRQVDASDPSWTASAFPHSEKYGFGVVDALAAVTRAATWANVSAETAVPSVAHAVGVAIPDDDATGVSDGIAIGSEHAGFSVEHVEVELTATHAHRGDLEVTLTSPSGVVSHLGTLRPGDAGANFAAWRFNSVRHWSESAAGTWTLNVADRAAGSTGVFAGWTLRIYGTAPPPAAPAPSGGGGGGGGGGAGSGGGAPPEPAPAPAPAPTPNSGPGAPTNLGSSVLGTTVVLSWTPPASGSAPTAYILEAGSTSGASNVVVASTGSVVTSYTATGVRAGTYFVRVRAVNGLGTSLPSNEIVVTVGTSSAPPSSGPSGPPSGLVASSSGSSITLTWNRAAVGGSPTFYVVQAGSAPGLSDLASFSTGSTVPSFSANGVGAGTYFVRVRAGNDFGISSPSNESVLVVGGASPGPGSGACAGPPTAPNSLQFSVSGSTVTLAWNPASSGPTSYVVEAGSSSGRADLAASDTGNTATSFTANGVGAGTYFVRMRARNACGASAASNEVIVVVR